MKITTFFVSIEIGNMRCYTHPNQSKFLDIFDKNLPKLNTYYREIYFQGNFNINLFEKEKYIFR